MSKRVCQTCRHFRAAGFDNMGWCNHPRRRGGTEVKLLARSLELQCRNDWDQDLWQGLVEGESTSFAIDRVVAPLRPVTPGEIATIAASENRTRLDEGASGGEDVVVAEVTPRFSTNKAAAQGDGFKVGISKAHEEVRARHRAVREAVLPVSNFGDVPGMLTAEQSAAPSVAQTPDTDGEVNLSSQHAGHPRPIIGEVSPVALGEMGRPFPKLTTFPEDDEIFSSIPRTVEGFDLPFITKTAPERIVKRAGFDEDDREIRPWNHSVDETGGVETADSFVESDSLSSLSQHVEQVLEPVDTFPQFEERPRFARDEVVVEQQVATQTDDEVQRPQVRGARRSSRGEFDLSVFDLTPLEQEPAAPERPERLTPRSNRNDEWVAASSDKVIDTIRAFERDELVLEERSVLRPARPRQTESESVTGNTQTDPILDDFSDVPPVRLPRAKRERLESIPETRAHVTPVSSPSAERRIQQDRLRDRTPTIERDEIQVIDSTAEPAFEGDSNQEPVRRSRRTQSVQTSDGVYDSDPVGAAPEASIPRMCKTCRDFRPSENGERGWCNNKWAFTHRRMVDAEELPCETTIGRWWLPHDDHWATVVDISNHSRPTPFLDQWMAQRAEANGEGDTAAQIRRRHRS